MALAMSLPTSPIPVTLPSASSSTGIFATTSMGPVEASNQAIITNGKTSIEISAPETAQAETPTPSARTSRFLQPDSFYPLNNGAHPTASSSARKRADEFYASEEDPTWLSPEDDPLATRGIPIFRPTLEEFQDFEGYVTRTVPWGQRAGITKIIPPEGWKQTLPPIDKRSLADLRISNPIQQNIFGSSGLFKQTNIEKNKKNPLTVRQWFEKCQEKVFAMPNPNDADRAVNRDSKEAVAKRAELVAEMKLKKEDAKQKRMAARARKMVGEDGPSASTNDQDDAQAPELQQDEMGTKPDTPDGDVPPLEASSRTSTHSSPEPLAQTPESDGVDSFYQDFKLTEDWLPKGARPEDYTPEACHRLERMFWKNMGIGEPSWYGADLQGSLFADKETPWNVSNLPNLLNRSKLKANLPGVNSPYLYFGMWRAAFSWHVEDMDLFSINYIHFGAPKFWYAIPQGQAEHFERTLSGYFEQESRTCDQFLRHKSFNVSPQRLARDGLRVNMLVHNQNEFVITYPRGYHSGFNLGFNCAESINFALDCWVELGRRAKACQCIPDSVRIDMDELLAEEELVDAIQEERKAKRARKADAEEEDTPSRPKKKLRTPKAPKERQEPEFEEDGAGEVIYVEDSPIRPRKPKQVIQLSAPRPPAIVQTPVDYPCLFCPSLSTLDLIPIHSPAEYVRAYSKSKEANLYGHKLCVQAIPEVSLERRQYMDKMYDVVVGVDDISKDRWNLKCSACLDKKLAVNGAKIQCTKGKCPKAFHVSCAHQSQSVAFSVWEVQSWEPLPLPDGAPMWTNPEFKQVKAMQYELLCPTHNPAVKEMKKQQALQEHKSKILALIPGSMIKIRAAGALYEANLIRAIEESQQVQAMTSDGLTRVFDWFMVDLKPKKEIPVIENEYAREYVSKRSTSGSVRGMAENTDVNRTGLEASAAPSARPPRPSKSEVGSAVTSNQRIQQQATQHRVHPPPSGSRIMAPPPHHHQSGQIPGSSTLNPLPRQSEIPTRVVICQEPDGRGIGSHQRYSTHTGYPQPYSAPNPFNHARQPTYPPAMYQQPYTAHGYQPMLAGPSYSYPNWNPYAPPLLNYMPSSSLQSYPQLNADMYNAPVSIRQHSNGVHPVAGTSSNSNIGSGGSTNGLSAGGPTAQPVSNSSNGVGKIDLGLDRMRKLMSCLPKLRVPAIHLAGTNGKGSVSAILESCLLRAGLRTGRYNSPHLIEPRDAIRIDGQPPSAQEYAHYTSEVQNVNKTNGIEATTFEIATAAAYHLINSTQPPIDVMVIECGMGGAKDATNVIPPELVLASGLTSVGLDHTAFLGDTIGEIATEKAKIVVQGGLLVIAPHQQREALEAAFNVAIVKQAKIVQARAAVEEKSTQGPISLQSLVKPEDPKVTVHLGDLGPISTTLPLHGPHQLDNLSLALTILASIRSHPRAVQIQPKIAQISLECLQRGAAEVKWPGRCSWELWNDGTGRKQMLLVDGAHNSDSARELRSYIDKVRMKLVGAEREDPITFIISLSDSKGKTIESVLQPLLRTGERVGLVEFTTPVAGMPWVQPVPKGTVSKAVEKIVGSGRQVYMDEKKGEEGLLNTLKWAVGHGPDRGMVVVCGSLYLVADLYRAIGQR